MLPSFHTLMRCSSNVLKNAPSAEDSAATCSGRGDCLNGTCLCEIRYAGEECSAFNLSYHAGVSAVFYIVAVVSAIQLVICILAEYQRLKQPTFLRACRLTTQKFLYFMVFLAASIRGAYFTTPRDLQPTWAAKLMSAYYPLLMTCSSLVVCLWAELKLTNQNQFETLVELMEKNEQLARGFLKGIQKADIKKEWASIAEQLNSKGPPIRDGDGWQKIFHLRDVRWEKSQFLSKSFLGFVAFNFFLYSLFGVEVFSSLVSPNSQHYAHIFNGIYAALLLIVVVFFLIYGVEVFFKLRGGFIYDQSGKFLGPNEAIINASQLHQSRLGLLSQAIMLIVIVGFLTSETLGDFWKKKYFYKVDTQPYHQAVFQPWKEAAIRFR